MIINISEESADRIREITKELLDIALDEVESMSPTDDVTARRFGWYQVIVQIVMYILTAANEVLHATGGE